MSEFKEPHNLPTAELTEAAEQEAKFFRLPEDWREGREIRYGIAIDAGYSLDRDDAISITAQPDGSYILHVSIADTGSFLYNQPAVCALAKRHMWTFYRDTSIVAPLIPAKLSQDIFSLLPDQERPVMTVHVHIGADNTITDLPITRDVLSARAMTYQDVDTFLAEADPSEPTELHHLERAARRLFAIRHQGAAEDDAVLEDEEGRIDSDQIISRLIVQESMIAAGASMARFMQMYGIPGLYRVHTPDESMLQFALLTENQLLARYNTFVEPHHALRLPAYAHVTSPLRRYADFANLSNIAAFLDGRKPVVPLHQLERAGARMNHYEQERRPEIDRYKIARRLARQRTLGRTATDFTAEIQAGTITESDLERVLFGTESTDELRRSAAAFIAKNIQLARSVINVAVSRKHITLQPTDRKNHFELIEKDGKRYPYIITNNPDGMAITSANLIANIVGAEVTLEIPEHMTYERKILANSTSYLLKLRRERRLRYQQYLLPQEEGSEEVTAVAIVIIGGVTHKRTATATSKRAANNNAAAQLIIELDLLANPPAPETPAPKAPETDPNKNPVVIVQRLFNSAHEEQPAYTFEPIAPSPTAINRCTVTATYKRQSYEFAAEGASNTEAKRAAAQLLLDAIRAAQ